MLDDMTRHMRQQEATAVTTSIEARRVREWAPTRISDGGDCEEV
jgi:hypothetical protein